MPEPETMTMHEFATLRAQALMDRDEMGRLSYETRQTLEKIKDGRIVVLDEGYVAPLEDLP